MIVAIHQPNFIPWLGYFYKINRSDTFVLLDDVQYTKNSFINRNRIKAPNGEQWVTMPVFHTGNFGQKINETQLKMVETNFKKFLRTLTVNYSKAKHFSEIISILSECGIASSNLAQFNERIIRKIVSYLEIETPIFRSSSLPCIETTSTERLIQICNYFNADCYLAGFGSINYQDDSMFRNNGIEPTIYSFSHPRYEQLYDPFIPNLSIIDLLMNLGKGTIQYL